MIRNIVNEPVQFQIEYHRSQDPTCHPSVRVVPEFGKIQPSGAQVFHVFLDTLCPPCVWEDFFLVVSRQIHQRLVSQQIPIPFSRDALSAYVRLGCQLFDQPISALDATSTSNFGPLPASARFASEKSTEVCVTRFLYFQLAGRVITVSQLITATPTHYVCLAVATSSNDTSTKATVPSDNKQREHCDL